MKSFIALIIFTYIYQVDSSMLIEVLQTKHIKDVVLINCDLNYDKIQFQNDFARYGKSHTMKVKTNITDDIRQNYHKIGIVVNTSCHDWRDLFKGTDEVATRMFKSPFIWFVLTKNLSDSANFLSQFPIEVDSDVNLLEDLGNLVNIYEIYNTGFFTNGTFHVKFRGNWSRSKVILKKTTRTDFTGVVLKCMTVVTKNRISDSFTHYMELAKELYGTDTLHKLKFFILLKYLREIYHFNYDLKRTKSWGYLSNGSFDGMVGALQRREVDIGGAPIFFWAERAKVIDYTVQTWQARQTFLLRHPKRIGAFYTIFTHPLSSSVWYSMLGIIVISALFLAMLLRLKFLKLPEDEPDSSAGMAILSIWSAVCQQGMFVNRGSTSINLVILSTFICTLTVYQYYNASVVSSLLREAPKNIRTLEDLTKSNLKAGIENNPYNTDYFKRTTNPIAIQLYKEKIETKHEKNILDLNHGMSLVKRGGFAFHVDASSAYHYMRQYFSESEICEVQEIQLFPPMETINAIKKGSPYKETITRGLRRMLEVGIFKRIKSVWDQGRPDCVHTPDSSVFAVSIFEVSAPFIALSGGIVLSVVILCAERSIHRYNEVRGLIMFRH